MKVTHKYTAGGFVLLAAFLIWIVVRPVATSPAPVIRNPLPPSLPVSKEVAPTLSQRGPTSTPAAQPTAATRRRTEEEEKAFGESGEYHLLLDLYGPLISQLRLEPREAADLVEILREVRLSLLDSAQVGRAEKLSNPDAITQVVEEAATFRDSRIRDLLGPERYAEFNTYRERLPQSITVHILSDLLVAAGNPLTDAQARSLVQLYFDLDTPMHRRLAGAIGLVQVNGVRLTDEMIRASATVLSPNQMSSFEKLAELQDEGYFQRLGKRQDMGK